MSKNSEFNQTSIEQLKIKALEMFSQFSGTIKSIDIAIGGETKTAEADVGKINLNKSYMGKLSDDEQLFIFMHEVCHIVFGHVGDIYGKDSYLWNVACDAVVNAWLKEKGGLEIKSGLVYIPNALEYDCVEDLYNDLKAKKDKKDGMLVEGKDESKKTHPYGLPHDDHSNWMKNSMDFKKWYNGKKMKPPGEKAAFEVNQKTSELLKKSNQYLANYKGRER